MRFDSGGCLVTLCLALLFWIAGAYLGGSFGIIASFIFTVLALDVLHLVLSARSIRYVQDFPPDGPLKGRQSVYNLGIRPMAGIPACRTTVRFKPVRDDLSLDTGLRDLDFIPPPGRYSQTCCSIRFPYRGVYTVGLESFELHDILGLMVLRMPVWHEVFRVLPRLVSLPACRLRGDGDRFAAAAQGGGTSDPAQFRGLVEYRPGQGIRHMAWKKFASVGQPFLREYDASVFPGAVLYLDGVRRGEPDEAVLDAEDCSVETALALCEYFTGAGVPVRVRVDGQAWEMAAGEDLDSFLRDSVDLRFRPPGLGGSSPIGCFESDLQDGRVPETLVIGVFRGFDRSVAAFLEDYDTALRRTLAVVVASGLSSDAAERLDAYLSLPGREERLAVVRGSGSITEDLA